ncbi:uncharacterized protein LACBIDRAFT_305975 [Laccaria bicolor S238N-H82]|uniref:Predicted protein n=1 Tax=Laccaria bicolor (strain S238N-H82 / ATCC MYA-4686) TaxID=486041 RepID=B0CSE2_LACBS|nr:uncharacterized protein LACBIDRAFT_305975 [Laccaria bicolor S238N-H82]EDR14292.1 predicted protein [Laccaria bicolor S238N-H82]|eukprot:XP_001874851.1 predicted protein [Laccaria bicolor S238N-H82]
MVPSLVYYCLHLLSNSPDQAHLLNLRLNYRSSHFSIPDKYLDPRLWATLVQIYNGLPTSLSVYNLPFDNPHLNLLQHISNTSLFSLVTILELPGCSQVTDVTITRLGALHTLIALDASSTSLTPYAIRTLAATLQTEELSHRGPWPLRILRLRNCKNITNDVFPHLAKFVLLSVIDLRGTKCSSIPPEFNQGNEQVLYHPSSLYTALSALQKLSPTLHSSKNPFTLQITTFNDPLAKPQTKVSTVAPQNSFAVIPRKKTGSQSRNIIIGNTATLFTEEEQRQAGFYSRNKQGSFSQRPKKRDNLSSSPPVYDPDQFFLNEEVEDESIHEHLDVERDRDTQRHEERDARQITAHAFFARPQRRIGQLPKDPGEAKLMLYREPLAWSHLAKVMSGIQKKEMIRIKKKKEESGHPEIAVVDRRAGKAAAARQQLGELLVKRAHEAVNTVPQQNQPPPRHPSRNPFKRK